MTTVLAGFMGGTLMGLVFVTHISLLLAFRPPKALLERASRSSITGLAMYAAIGGIFTWTFAGTAAAFVFRAVESNYPGDAPGLPSPLYTMIVVLLGSALTVPLAVLLRDRLLHVLGESALFAVVFGWLIPALEMALR
jgi:hypothetical protein